MTADVHGFYADLGIQLPQRNGLEAPVRCFANPTAHRNGDRHPSASVNLTSGVFHCHTCGAAGGAYDAALVRGRGTAEAMQLLERHNLLNGSYARPHRPRELRFTDADITRW